MIYKHTPSNYKMICTEAMSLKHVLCVFILAYGDGKSLRGYSGFASFIALTDLERVVLIPASFGADPAVINSLFI